MSYEKPNIEQVIDRKSGQNIARAIASVGQNAAKGIIEGAKIEAKGLEAYNKLVMSNNIIDNKIDEIITTETIAQHGQIDEKGLKGADTESFKKEIDLRLKEYGDALKRNKKNMKRKTYEGKNEDLKIIQNFQTFSTELPTLLESVNALEGESVESYSNGDAAGDTNPFWKAAMYMGKQTLPGRLTYSITNNADTGRLELNMRAKGESIKEINRTEAGYLGDVPMYGEMDPSGPPTFSDSSDFNLSKIAKEYNDAINPYNSSVLSTTANVDKIIRDIYNTNRDDPNNTTGAGTPFSEGNKINPAYQSDPIEVFQPDPNRQGELERGEVVFNQIQSLFPIATSAADQTYHNLSTLKGGNVTLTDSIMSEVKNGNIIQKDNKLFYKAYVDESGNLITESKNLRNSKGRINVKRTEVELLIPELNSDRTGNQIFTPESEASIKKWMTSKALTEAGAYFKPQAVTKFERYYPEGSTEEDSTIYNDMLAKVYSIDRGHLNKDEIIDIFSTSSPDGALIMTYEEYVKDINDNISKDFTEEDAKAKIAGLNKDDIFINQGDNLPVAFRKSRDGTYDKNIVISTIRNLYSGEGEQAKIDVASKIEADKRIKVLQTKIQKAQQALEAAKRLGVTKQIETKQNNLKKLQKELKRTKI